MFEWLRKRESKKHLIKLIEDPIEESNKLVAFLGVALTTMQEFSEGDRATIRGYFDYWVEKMMSESGQDPVQLYWATFKYGHHAIDLENSEEDILKLESIAINLARYYAKAIILLSHIEGPIDFSNASNLVEAFDAWQSDGELKGAALRVFRENPVTGGYTILMAGMTDET